MVDLIQIRIGAIDTILEKYRKQISTSSDKELIELIKSSKTIEDLLEEKTLLLKSIEHEK